MSCGNDVYGTPNEHYNSRVYDIKRKSIYKKKIAQKKYLYLIRHVMGE